jgi:hypothetical protein
MPLPALELDPACAQQLARLCGRLLPVAWAPREAAPRAGLATSQRLESRWVRTWVFETEEAAAYWNEGWDTARDPGHLHPALLSVEGAPIPDPTLDVVARIAAGVVHEEIHAGTPAPEVRAGSRFELVVCHRYEGASFSWRRDSLVMEVSWAVLTPEGEPFWSLATAREYDLPRLPPNAARVLTAIPRADTSEVYAPA